MADWDLAVVGAGAAGMLGALRAEAGGARVVLLERDADASSNLALSGGLFSAAGSRWQQAAGVEDSPARFAADIREKAGRAVPPPLLRRVTEGAREAAHFLADVAGLPIHLSRTAHFPGHSAPRLHATPAESGTELCALLRDAVRRRPGITWMDGADATALLAQQGQVTGVEVSAGGTRRPVAATWVLLATGGFGGGVELRARHMPEAAGALHIGSAASDGRGIGWMQQLGAALDCMDAYQGQPHLCREGRGGERLGAALPALGAVMVNLAGRRFAAEDMGPSELTAHVLAQAGGAVEIWDAAAQDAALRQGPFRAAVEAGLVWGRGDLSALAERFGLPEQVLAQTLADAAGFARGEGADPLGRLRWGAPLAAPFFAAAITGGLAHTQGGVLVDAGARVLRPDGGAIPGLLAAGGTACGVSGRGAAGYVPGNGLAQSFALGLAAGATAAR
ncbi:FAD-dependent oxidoreductase [Pseudoroseomonas ludipueritiae]|uniref:FAD-binding protein n=1 Tax=Pseudoroseomonas ludipueritiae TaxID=198093 RepID=A0ABR7RBE3_9PROT|nr:FAD-binding protein [Pseudoroseomonas ludipueritiae]MBC9178902.1 FAD-binding protein [Pseudoroseomonas ludipueritiae]